MSPPRILSAHVEVSPLHASRQGEVLEAIWPALRREYGIEHVTLQPECGFQFAPHQKKSRKEKNVDSG
jgi:Co/Zn/Cd efflux system component